MWFSTLEWVNPLYFEHELKKATRDGQDPLQEIFVFCRDEYSLQEQVNKHKKPAQSQTEALTSDKGERARFLSGFKQRFESTDKPEKLNELWELSQQPGFIPAHLMKRALMSKKSNLPTKMQINKWTKDRIKEAEAKL
ncbi:MAG: hypothetical protein HRU20_25280 [Pseudomonadales bacterium]|nr:hypothetical protein [Pseudomonadales bacterium]